MKRQRWPTRQEGFALWVIVFVLALGLGYGLYRAAPDTSGKSRQDAALAATLRQAKEALLARAVTDLNRPGSLPCPDIATDSAAMNNFPGDGKADMLAGNHCPAYVGWLPWLTLDLPELTDDTGEHLWYALSPNLRDDDSAQPLNSASAGTLEVDGQSDIVAVIIAPRTARGGQQRPSLAVADFLEGGNGLSNKYVSTSPSPGFNDSLISISRGELMAAIGKRISGELRKCLEQHADASINGEHRYPWPAPLSTPDYQGHGGSHFGRVPVSQPNSGPEAALQANIDGLNKALDQLTSSTDAKQQLSTLGQLNAAAVQAGNLLQAVFVSSSRLKQAADQTAAQLSPLAESIQAATANGRISRSEGSAIRTLGENANATLDKLPQLLGESGLDPFAWELARHNAMLAEAPDPATLAGEIQALRQLLDITYSRRADLAPPLAAAQTAALPAQQAVQAAVAQAGDAQLLGAAKTASASLLAATTALAASQAASRVNVLASDINDFPALLEESLDDFKPPATDTLVNALRLTRDAQTNIKTGLADILRVRDESLAALTTAILAAQSTPANGEEIVRTTRQAIAASQALSAAIAANEAADNNLSRSSLQEAIRAYRAAQMQFSDLDTATPRPLQSDIVAPAEGLDKAGANIASWLQIISANSTLNAQAAKAEPAATEEALANPEVLADSGEAAASSLLASLGKSSEALQAYLNKPDSDSQHKAANAVAASRTATQTLISQEKRLASSLTGTTASAFPMVWNAASCAFLRLGQTSWWNDNRWFETLFYQFSQASKAAPGKLAVDASGSYRLVVIASGPALSGQQREIPSVANFLEGRNADPSRDGEASHPVKDFSGAALSPDFNDRLAF